MKHKNKKQEKLDFEKVWQMFKETDLQIKETSQQMKETDRFLKERSLEMDNKLEKIGKMCGGISNNMGDAAEDFFYHGLSSTMKLGNIKYDMVYRNLRKRFRDKEGEFDDILVNSNSVVVVEVKYKIHPNDVKELLSKQVPLFKELFPEYANFKIYGAIAGFAIPESALKEAQRNGFFVLTQKGEDMALLNEKGFKPVQQ